MNSFDATKLLSQRTSAVEEAAILRMAQKARDLRASGRDIVSLTVGEPDFDTPGVIQSAATEAMRKGLTHYAPVAGIPELRNAIARKLRNENNLDYSAAEIVLSNGAKQAITNAAFALIDKDDEAILLAPFWAAYEGIVRMAGGRPVILHAGVEENFKVPAERIEAAITPRTKLLLVNSPNNPSGAIHNLQELQAIAAVVSRHPGFMVVADEIYEHISYEGLVTSFGSLAGMRARTITVNGFSKAYAMTGWRLGYAAAAEPVARAMAKVQGTFTAGANAFVQHAAIVALEKGAQDIARMRDVYRKRRNVVIDGLRAISGIKVSEPAGTFYAFPDVSAFLHRKEGTLSIDTVEHLCDWLLENHGLATVPGSAFGDDSCIRLSFAAAEPELLKGVDRLRIALEALNGSLRT